MPLTINVGLSRKSSKDFQSSGRPINLTAELDQALLSKQDELQQKIDTARPTASKKSTPLHRPRNNNPFQSRR